MAATYSPIASITVGASTATVTFSSIPSTYTDLVIVGTGTFSAYDGYSPWVRFNGDSGNNYSQTVLSGNGTSATSSRTSSQAQFYTGSVTGWDTSDADRAMFILHIFNYANTTTNKTSLSRQSVASGTYPGTELLCGLWRSTAAINKIDLTANTSGTFSNVGTTFSLYGILGANA